MDVQARQFSIALAQLTQQFIKDGLPPDIALGVLQDKVEEELRLQKSRRAAARSY